LQYISSKAFSNCPLKKVVFPATLLEISPSAFSNALWRSRVRFEGPPLFAIDNHFLLSLDSRIIFRALSSRSELLIGSNIEGIGAGAFDGSEISAVIFESGSRLSEIGAEAFSSCRQLRAFSVPESVEVLGDGCFRWCSDMDTIAFEGSSRMRRIGEHAFSGCNLQSITIPQLTEEIDGSAFVNCPLIAIRVATGNLHFKIEGSMVVTSDGTGIVRYFGLDREIFIGNKFTILGKSCFEDCKHLDRINFEVGSTLERIDRAALRDCSSLPSIEIPATVTVLEE
jgi:hypothetical protein